MVLQESVRQAAAIIGLTHRYLLGTRRLIPMILLAWVPFILATSLAAGSVPTYDLVLFQALMVPLFLQVVLIFVTLVNATTLVREEIEDNTFPYLLTRPLSKPAIAFYKYAGYLIAVLVLLLPPVVLAFAATQSYTGRSYSADLDVLEAFVLSTVLGSAAYGAIFLFFSVLVRKPLFVGLLFGFVWESIVGSIPGDVPKLSVIHYLKSVIKDIVPVGSLSSYPTDVDAGLAVAILVTVSLGMVFLTMFQLQQMEFREKV
jgi:ABC-2 type transport system permease protein